jgi:hypothetical protein
VPSRRHELHRRRARAFAAWLGVVIVALGWMQSLVVCTKPCCGGHVRLAPRCDAPASTACAAAGCTVASPARACCAHDATVLARGDGSPQQAAPRRCGGCQHVALGVELGLPPEPAHPDAAPMACVAVPPTFAMPAAGDARRVVHPPATGPPRCDERTALRASTLLLL